MSEEIQTCPRRMTEPGPWEYKENLDLWRTDRWSADREAVERKHDTEDARGLREHNERCAVRGEPPITLDEYRTKWSIRGPSNDLWLGSGTPPRTCNFCGGIHPEDAIRLVEEGWRVEGTTKGYKRYLNPPAAANWSPTPPVKLYVQHFSDEQIARFNGALRPKPT